MGPKRLSAEPGRQKKIPGKGRGGNKEFVTISEGLELGEKNNHVGR